MKQYHKLPNEYSTSKPVQVGSVKQGGILSVALERGGDMSWSVNFEVWH